MSNDDADLVNYLVRMVIPMRREFGRKLDIGQFRLDAGYADEVLGLARQSLDPRLREYGLNIEQRLLGARGAGLITAAPARAVAPFPVTGSVESAGVAPAGTVVDVDKAAEDALRAKVMKKYTSGLR